MFTHYLNTVILVDTIQNRAETVQVPDILVVVEQGSRDICTVDWWIKCHVLPIFPFQVDHGLIQWWCVPVLRTCAVLEQ